MSIDFQVDSYQCLGKDCPIFAQAEIEDHPGLEEICQEARSIWSDLPTNECPAVTYTNRIHHPGLASAISEILFPQGDK